MAGTTPKPVQFNTRLVSRVLAGRPLATLGLVVAGLAATTAATWFAGGTQSVAPQLAHLFVVAAAVILGPRVGIGAGVVAGLLLGPAMPLDVAAGTMQSPQSWLLRLGVFVVVGLGTGVLARGARRADVAFRRTLEQLPIAVVAGTGTEADGVLTYANRAATDLLGPVVGMSLMEVFEQVDARTTDGRPVGRAEVSRASAAIASGVPARFSLTDRGGRRRVVRLRALRTPNGQAVAAIEDVTSNHHLERTRRELITAAGHHLRTPLTPVVGFASMIVRHAEATGDDTLHEYARALDRNAQRLHSLVERLTQLAELTPASTRDYRRVGLRAVAEQACEQLGSPGGVVNLVPHDLEVEVAPDHVRAAVAELVTNALTHSRPPVVIDALHRGDRAIDLIVGDDGPGLPEGIDLADLFAAYTGVEAATENQAPRGQGLGLALADAHCHASGSTLSYDPDLGFVITLPH